jgi:hypothetical protein
MDENKIFNRDTYLATLVKNIEENREFRHKIKLYIVFFIIINLSTSLSSQEIFEIERPLIIDVSSMKSNFKLIEKNVNDSNIQNNILKLDSFVYLIKNVKTNNKYSFLLNDTINIEIPFFDSINKFYKGGLLLKYISVGIKNIEFKDSCLKYRIYDENIIDLLGGGELSYKEFNITQKDKCENSTIISISERKLAKPYKIFKKIPKKIRSYFKYMHWINDRGRSIYT